MCKIIFQEHTKHNIYLLFQHRSILYLEDSSRRKSQPQLHRSTCGPNHTNRQPLAPSSGPGKKKIEEHLFITVFDPEINQDLVGDKSQNPNNFFGQNPYTYSWSRCSQLCQTQRQFRVFPFSPVLPDPCC